MSRRYVFILSVFFSVVVLLGLGYYIQRENTLVQGGLMTPVILIDPGHGGEDGGAVGISGEIESQINLSISQNLEQLLLLYGMEAILLREEDISLHEEGADTFAEKKSSDLKQRVAMINSYSQGILLSIHQNSFTDPRYSGAQVFFASGSEDLGIHVQSALQQGLDPENTRVSKLVDSSLYLMNRIEMPAILVECGFLSHHHEALLLGTPQYQMKIACVLTGAMLTREQTFT